MNSPKRRAVFLDRDGVLNDVTVRGETPYPPANRNEVKILPGVIEAIAALKEMGFLRIVVTNQPDVARKTQTLAEVEAINNVLVGRLDLDEFCVCPHDNVDQCNCRKPRPGLLLTAAQKYDVDLAGSFMIGDRSGDVLAGVAAGCRTFLIERPYSKAAACKPDFIVGDLAEAVRIIAGLTKNQTSTNR